MYAKIFTQIFDSSIAENYEVRHVFEDLLKLADREGVVDMTIEAIARRANMPLEKVRFAIAELLKPDPESRSKENEGRRIVPLDSRRTWGWIILNYAHYRAIQDEETRRTYFRDAQRRHRQKKAKPKGRGKATDSPAMVSARYDSEQAQFEAAHSNGDQVKCDEIAARASVRLEKPE